MTSTTADQLHQLIAKWRAEASELDKATDGTWIEPSVKLACADELEAILAAPLPQPAKELEYKPDKRCCSICDARKVCHVCGEQTLLACSDCRINFSASVYVCQRSQCRNEHERRCFVRGIRLPQRPLPQPEGWQPIDVGLSANDTYHVMQQWEKMPASTEETRIVIALGKLRELYIKRGDSPFVSPLPPAPLVTEEPKE